MRLTDIVHWLDHELSTEEYTADRSLNGLQVGGEWPVDKMAFALDARPGVIRKASEANCQLLVVHHGIFWGKPFPITGRMFDLLDTCIRNQVALYACHLPLDAHTGYGVNATWVKALSLQQCAPLTQIWGADIGVVGQLPSAISIDQFARTVADQTSQPALVRRHGPKSVATVAVLGGSAGPGEVQEAKRKGADVLLTGEQSLPVDIEAEIQGIGLVFAGHTASELPGIQSLKERVDEEFNVGTVLIHDPSGV